MCPLGTTGWIYTVYQLWKQLHIEELKKIKLLALNYLCISVSRFVLLVSSDRCMCVRAYLFSRVWLFVTPWMIAHQTPLSMGFSRQEYWSGLPFPPPGYLPDPGIEEMSPASLTLQMDSSLLSHQGLPDVCGGSPNIYWQLLACEWGLHDHIIMGAFHDLHMWHKIPRIETVFVTRVLIHI